VAVGQRDLLIHDLRMSGVRDLIRAPSTEDVAMKISGHKTRAVFRRYDTTSTEDIHMAGGPLAQFKMRSSAESSRVAVMRGRKNEEVK
jgi:hypothetical protein